MLDTIKSIIWGFSGKLEHDNHARKIVWALMIVAFFSLCCVFFAAYVSYSRYKDLAGFLPFANVVGFCFTIGMAGFMFAGSSYVALFCAQKWMGKETDLHGGIATAFFVSMLIIGYADFNMNLDGVNDVARAASGKRISFDDSEIRSKYQGEITRIQNELDNLANARSGESYSYWRYSGSYSNRKLILDENGKKQIRYTPSGRKRRSELELQLKSAKTNRDNEIASLRSSVDNSNGEMDSREAITKDRLTIAVRAVYFIQFVLCLIMALLGVVMSKAMGNVHEKGGHNQKVDTYQNTDIEEGEEGNVPSKGGQGMYKGTSMGYGMNRTSRKGSSQKKDTNSRKRTSPKMSQKKKTSKKKSSKKYDVITYSERADSNETFAKIMAARNAIIQQKQKPTHKKIAQAVGCSTKTVQRHMRRYQNTMAMIE